MEALTLQQVLQDVLARLFHVRARLKALLRSSPIRVESITKIGELDGHSVFKLSDGGLLGCGSYGIVVSGYHPHYGHIALKSPRFALDRNEQRQIQRFRNEANLWMRLRHPNVLRFLGTIEGPARQDLWLASEFVSNGCLPGYLRANPQADRLRLAAELACGLAYLHSKCVVHGDLKGSNVLICANGHAKLADFGLAKLVDTTTTTSMRGVGSLRWQAPELMERGRWRSFESDVYAFGLTLSEILNGNLPFPDCSTDIAVVQAVLRNQRPATEPMQSPSGQSYSLVWRVAAKCWAPNPNDRPSISAVCRILSGHGLPSQATIQARTTRNYIPFVQKYHHPIPLWAVLTTAGLSGIISLTLEVDFPKLLLSLSSEDIVSCLYASCDMPARFLEASSGMMAPAETIKLITSFLIVFFAILLKYGEFLPLYFTPIRIKDEAMTRANWYELF